LLNIAKRTHDKVKRAWLTSCYHQAVKQAASVRNQVLEGFESLIPIFSDVELFLGTFRGDMNIKNMSVELTVTTLTAIEQAIGFFTSNERKSYLPLQFSLARHILYAKS
jgi:hypothetical protein